MKVSVRNCNSIVKADIEIEQGRLNIKYGPNGTGKSTLARAIELSTKGEEEIRELTPFMYMGQETSADCEPQIQITESVQSVSTFNESYIEQFVFQPDEVVQNSFEIFIKTREYDERMNEIESLISSIKATLESDNFLECCALMREKSSYRV